MLMDDYENSWPNEMVMMQWCKWNLIEKYEYVDKDYRVKPMIGCMHMKRDVTKWNGYMNTDECNTI